MKSGNVLLKGCLYFWGGLFLLGLLVQVALPLAICGLIGFGAYLLVSYWVMAVTVSTSVGVILF